MHNYIERDIMYGMLICRHLSAMGERYIIKSNSHMTNQASYIRQRFPEKSQTHVLTNDKPHDTAINFI